MWQERLSQLAKRDNDENNHGDNNANYVDNGND